jgi:hypothetical protein
MHHEKVGVLARRLTTMTVRGALPQPLPIPVYTGHHKRRTKRDRWTHVHMHLGAATTIAHLRAFELVLWVLDLGSTNENAP